MNNTVIFLQSTGIEMSLSVLMKIFIHQEW